MRTHLTKREIDIRTARSRSRTGFTLVELLTAMTITVLLLVLIGQLYGHVNTAAHTSQQQMNATEACRAVLAALDNDLSNVVTQFGSSVYVKSDAATSKDGVGRNVQLIFLTARRGPAPATPLGSSPAPAVKNRWTATAYQLNATGYPAGQLIRKTASVPWSSPDLAAAALTADTSTTSSPIANNILTLQAVLLLDKAYQGQTLVPVSTSGTWLTSTSPTGQTLTDGFQGLVLTDRLTASANPRVRSLIVGVAAEDDQVWKVLAGQATAFGNALQPSPLNPGNTPVDVWNQQVSAGKLSSYPRPAVAAVEVSQRIFLLR